jgi:hypothetical protein
VTNPGQIATDNRRKELNKVYASKEWERACDEVLHRGHILVRGIIRGEGLQVGEAGMLAQESWELLSAKIPCEWHLRITGEEVRVGTLVHHTYLESYKDGTYLDLKTIDKDILCGRCHYAIHHDLDLCKCGRYMRRGAHQCKTCFDKAHPEMVEAKRERDAKRKKDERDRKARIKADKRAERERYRIDHPLKKKPKVKSASKNHANKSQDNRNGNPNLQLKLVDLPL